MTKGDELLACPFCSSTHVNLFAPIYPMSADCDDALVRCGHCDAQGPSFLCDMDDDDAEIHWPASRQAAITAWNTRSQK